MHFIASWFFIYAFQTLSYLFDTKLIDIVRHSEGQGTINALIDNDITASDLVYIQVWTNISGLFGLFTAFIISLTITIKRHWFWANALSTFIVTYFLYSFDLLGWTYIKQFFWYLGQRFNNSTAEFLLNGIILLTIGILFFFLKQTNQFIENNKLGII
jgi:hypothetical protein